MKKLKCKKGGAITKTGYLPDSPDRFNEFNVIPSNQITMKGVSHPVFGIDDQGNQMLMHPGADYTFPGNYVTEVPIRQQGGAIKSDGSFLGDWGAKVLTYLQSPELEKKLKKSKAIGRDVTNILDPTGVTNWGDAQAVWGQDVPLGQKLLTTAGAVPFFGEAPKALGVIGKSELGWKLFANLLEKSQDVNQLADDVSKKQEGGNVYDNDYYAQNATLSYYKNLLNDKLKAKNPKAFQDYFTGLVKARQSGNSGDKYKYIQETPYEEYLSPDEVKETLGDNYNTYLNSLQAVNKYKVQQGQQPLYGSEEGQKNLDQLNYGRRFASLEVTPSLSYTNKTRNTTYARNYNYDPQNGVSYTESGDMSLNPFIAKKQNGGIQPAGVPGTNPGQRPPNFLDKITAGINNFDNGVINYMNNPYNIGNAMDLATGAINAFSQNSKDKQFNNYLRDNMTGDSFAVNPGGDRGDYQVTGSAYGMFRPDQMGAKSPYGTNGMYYPRAANGGIIADEIDTTPQFMGNSSTREFVGSAPEMAALPSMPQVGPTNTPINFPTYNSNKQVSVNNNTKAAYDYYTKEKNLPSHIAAGIVGNLYQESGLKPGAVETTNTAAGRGIAQWGVNDRWQGFLHWARSQNRDPYDLKSQLDYVLVEPGESGKALERLKNTTTPEQAAVIFGKLYERPKDSLANWDTRTSIASRLASGRFQQGGEYEMTDDELQQFIQSGGEVEFID